MNNNLNYLNAMTQRELIYKYNNETRERFNPELFTRDEDRIVEELKKIILSCERNKKFIIKVESFEIVEDYEEMMNLLYEYESQTYRNSKKKRLNPYEYVTLKDSEFKLMKVNYYIEAKGRSDRFTSLILVPKIVEKYYFKISGNVYYAMFQIADGTTYNNSTSNSKCPQITLRPTFNPLRIYKKEYELQTVEGELLSLTYYIANVSNKFFDTFKYILAKYGLLGTFRESKIPYINFSKKKVVDENSYCIEMNNHLYLTVPKYILDNDLVTQSLVATIYRSLLKEPNAHLDELYEPDFWLRILGSEFRTKAKIKQKELEKGQATLESLESLYDIPSKESYKLPEEIKCDIYHILLWIMREFGNLRIKNNLDLSTKKVKYAEYIASLYSMKLIRGIYRLDNSGVTIEGIIKAIRIKPTYLLEAITSCRLIKYRELVNDLDAIIATKFTNKYVSGIHEQKKKSKGMPPIFRYVYPSHLGIIDLDASPKSDPGISGSFCPTAKLYDGYFSKDFEEPNFWEEEFEKMSKDYQAMVGIKEALVFRKEVLNEDIDEYKIECAEEDIQVARALCRPIMEVETTTEYVSPFVYFD